MVYVVHPGSGSFPFSLSKMPGIPNYFDFVYLGMLRMNLMFNFRKVLKWAKFFSWMVIVVGAGAVAGAVVLSSISSSRVFLFFSSRYGLFLQ